MLALGFFESGNRSRRGAEEIEEVNEVGTGGGGRIFTGEARVATEFGERNAELFAWREEDGTLDEIFEFANVAGPGIVGEASMASAGMYSTALLSWRLNLWTK